MERSLTCSDCAHYYQHYIRTHRRFVEIHDGHCVAAPRARNRTPDTPDQSIKCTVTNCAHHCQDQNYCGLNAITVGTHETNPTKVECTDCQSFQMK